MKKNISINLFGTVYAIDEDAYNLLERYIDSMKSYFSRQEGGEEIADDIEHRVAELLWQQKEAGAEAVCIQNVKEIIKTIGNPVDIENEAGANAAPFAEEVKEGDKASQSENANSNESTYSKAEGSSKSTGKSVFEGVKANVKSRHLYRNPKDKILGGVCSGLAEYIGMGEPVFYRLGAIILTFVLPNIFGGIASFLNYVLPYASNNITVNFGFGFSIPLLYIALWIIVPEAHTAEDRLRMKGKEVNPENLQEELINESDAEANEKKRYYATSNMANNVRKSGSGGCLKFFAGGCLMVLAFPFILALIGIIIATLFVVFLLCCIPFGCVREYTSLSEHDTSVLEALYNSSDLPYLSWLLVVCALIVIIIPIFLFIRRLKTDRKRYSAGARATFILTWIVSLVAGIVLICVLAVRAGRIEREIIDESVRQSMKKIPGTNDYLYDPTDYSFFTGNGWVMTAVANNVSGRYTYYGSYMTGDGRKRYLDADIADEDSVLVYTAEAKQFCTPGVYRLVANCRASRDGAYIYAYKLEDKEKNTMYASIPAYGDNHGNIWQTLCDETYSPDPIVKELVDRVKDKPVSVERYGETYTTVGEAVTKCYEEGIGWSFVYIDKIVLKESATICYGVTTVKDGKCNYQGWFSATDFSLEKIADL